MLTKQQEHVKYQIKKNVILRDLSIKREPYTYVTLTYYGTRDSGLHYHHPSLSTPPSYQFDIPSSILLPPLVKNHWHLLLSFLPHFQANISTMHNLKCNIPRYQQPKKFSSIA
jgi:hypothetical protein